MVEAQVLRESERFIQLRGGTVGRDVFVQGRVEMILRDLREGFRSRIMHFFIDGDNHRGPNNVAVVIPPGVGHAVRVEGSEDAIMVYGTSTNFEPAFEGRIASDVESALLPESWRSFLAEK